MMKILTVKSWPYLVSAGLFFIVGGVLLIKAPAYFFGLWALAFGIMTIVSFTVGRRLAGKSDVLISPGQRLYFVVCGAIASLGGALMLWERM